MPRLTLYGNIKVSTSVRITALGVSSLFVALALFFAPALPAYADQNPSGCNSNRLNTSLIKDKTAVYQGDTITYSVTVSNLNSGSDIACNITNATIVLTLPASDGTPTGTAVTLASGVDYPAGTGITVVGSSSYFVQVDPGVVDIVAQVSANGTLHDAPVNHAASIVKTLGTSVLSAPAGGGGGSGGASSSSRSATTATLTTPGLPNTGSIDE